MQDSFPFRHIEFIKIDQGQEVDWLTQDRNGFMWFAADNGLNRYDGYTFHSWSFNEKDSNAVVPGDWHWGIEEDSAGVLWIASDLKGFYSFDPLHEKFINHRNQPGNSNSLIYDRVWAIAIENRNIWLATEKGLDKYNTHTNIYRHFAHKEGDAGSISYDGVFSMVKDQTHLWLINKKLGIDCFDIKTEKVIKHFEFPFPKSNYNWTLEGNPSLAIKEIRNNVFWFGSNDNGIYGFNILTEQFIHIKIDHICRKKFVHVIGFYPVMEDHAGNLWTVNDDNELVYYHYATQKFYFTTIKVPGVYVSHNVSNFFEDKSGKIWIGTMHGLLTVNTKQKSFLTSQPNENVVFSISDKSIAHFQKERNVHLSVTDNILNLFWLKWKSYPFPFKVMPGMTNIYKDSKGIFWICGGSGISSYDPGTKRNCVYDGGRFEPFTGIVEDLKGRLWAASYGRGFFKIDTITKTLQRFGGSENINSVEGNFIDNIFKDSRGIIYLSVREGGFITFNPDSETFKIYHHKPSDPTSVNSESPTVYLEAKNGLIWFGTFGTGLNVFNPSTERFKAFTVEDGLPANDISSLTEDKKGNVWVGTSNGISCFTPPSDPFAAGYKIHFRNYNISDGLTSNICMFRSAFCDDDGTIYVGTLGGGLFYFHPDSLKDNDFIPPVYITEFRLKNKPVDVKDSASLLKSSIEYTKEIQLNYKQNDISFSFVALNYIHPEKNQYAYMLEGYDKDWIFTDASQRFANYTNLDPKKYIFKVKASNNDGVWNETPKELILIITPPFWQTVWFKVLIALMISGLIYTFYRYRIGQILLLQRIRNKIAADLHDDIGSTLNSISVYSEVAKKDESRRDFALSMIGESSRKIIDSISDIVWSINPENDSFDKLIFRMRSLTYNLLKAKKIDCTFKADESLNELKLTMQARRNFYLIFKEALNNLVKYSHADRASVMLAYENKQVVLIVRDNGVGFDPDAKYNGNGLSNIRKRANEINAKLNIESSQSIGTTIELNMKI